MHPRETVPFTHWQCDECGDAIRAPEDGWIEWRARDGVLVDFRIVHRLDASPRGGERGCYVGDAIGDLLLENALGDDGLAYLLGVLDRARVEQAQFAELVRRLQVPFYEEARNHRVPSTAFETNGIREYTQAGIAAKLRLPELATTPD